MLIEVACQHPGRDARIASDVSPVGDAGMGDYNWTVSDSDNHLVTCLYHPHRPPPQQRETRNDSDISIGELVFQFQ